MSDRRPTDDVMARELIAARARIAELEHERDALRQLVRAAAVASVAAQRPPLGYVVTFDDLYGRELAYDYRELIENKSDALDALETARFNQPSRAQAYQLAEVREVQP